MVNIREKLISQLGNIRQSIRIIPHTTITENIPVTLLEKRPGYSIVVYNKDSWMKKMRQLHEIYWNWINPRGLTFNYGKFTELCSKLWRYVHHYGTYVDYKIIYKRYKTLESRLPRSHAIIRDIRNPDKILLIKHHNEKLWSLPGGKLEDGENYDQALFRELYEEVNFEPTAHTLFIGNPKYHGNNASYEIWTKMPNDLKTNSPYEIAEVKWFSLRQMPENTKLLRRYLLAHNVKWKYINKTIN